MIWIRDGHHIRRLNGDRVAETYGMHTERTDNANLISAAPDLREACVQAAETIAGVIDAKQALNQKCEEEKAVLDLIVVALTKARGELR